MVRAVVTLSLARRADRFPDRTAVVDISEERLYAPAETIHENRVSYAELSEVAAETATRLESLGIEAGDTVCLLTRNRVASLALFFACRRLEATFAPISHLLTPVTVERPFDAGIDPELVVAEAAQCDLVRSIPVDRERTLTLSELAAVDSNSSSDSRASGIDRDDDPRIGDDQRPDSDHPLLLLHGEGGRPIVAYSARTLEWNCIAAIVTWGLSSTDTVPLVTSLSAYDGLVRGALPTLYAGGDLLLDRAFDPGDTLIAIEREDATLLAGRTTAFRNLAAESDFPAATDSLERAFPDASVPNDVLDSYREHGLPVARTYGRLECPIAIAQDPETIAESDNADAENERCVGHPVPDCRVRLQGGDGPLEEAVEGRLALSGPLLAEGYVGAADTADRGGNESVGTVDRTNEHANETADRGRFVDNWLETPDWFRRDEDGLYYFENTDETDEN